MLQVVLNRVHHAVEELHFVDGAVGTALAAGAVVADHDDNRVLQSSAFLEVVQQPPDVMVAVGDKAGVDLGHATKQALLVVVK